MAKNSLKIGLKQFYSYDMSHLIGDITAGIIVVFLLIPQSMAYANLAGVPPTVGLYAGTFPLLIYAVFGSSKYLSVGPVSIISMLTFTGLSSLESISDHHYMELVVILSLMVGIVQIVMSFLRFGYLLQHISSAVLGGFISAFAFIIMVNQFPAIIGIESPSYRNLFLFFIKILIELPSVHIITAGIGLISLLLLLVTGKFFSTSTAPFFVIISSIMVVDFFHMDERGVDIIGDVPGNFPEMSWIIPSWETLAILLPLAIVVGFVSFFESFSIAQSLASQDGESINVNQELASLGLANLASSYTGSIPVSGALSRSAVNYESGAQTKMSLVITAVLMLLAILYITPLFYYLPKAALASIIVFAVLKLINIYQLIYYLKNEPIQAVIFLVTFFAVIIVGVVQGFFIGIVSHLVVKGVQKIYS